MDRQTARGGVGAVSIALIAAGEKALRNTMESMASYRAAVARGEDGESERKCAHDNLDAFFDHLAALIMGEWRG